MPGLFLFSLLMCIWCTFYVAEAKATERRAFLIASFLCSLVVGFNCYIRLAQHVSEMGVSVAISCFVFLVGALTAFPIYRLFQNNGAPKAKTQMAYQDYIASCRATWFRSLSVNINNKSIYVKVFRIAVMSFCTLWGACIFVNIALDGNFLANYNTAILHLCLVLFGSLFFCNGPMYSLLLSVVAFAMLYGTKMLSAFLEGRLVSAHSHPLASFAICFFAIFGGVSAAIWLLVRWELFYTKVHVYERGDDSIAIDLFLNDFKPIAGLGELAAFRVSFDGLRELSRFLKVMLKACHATSSVPAGYYSDGLSSQIVFYAYASDAEALNKRLYESARRVGLEIEDFSAQEDPNWEKYAILYPDKKEMSTLNNRNQIEELYQCGIDPNNQYVVRFCIGFEDKNSPVQFEKELEHLGLWLAMASFMEGDRRYYGEYHVTTYVTLRRIEYLSNSIKNIADSFGAIYDGEWKLVKEF
jgi:hypothetical protein